MRTYFSFRVNRFLRVGIPVNLGSARTAQVPTWLAWIICAIVVILFALGNR